MDRHLTQRKGGGDKIEGNVGTSQYQKRQKDNIDGSSEARKDRRQPVLYD